MDFETFLNNLFSYYDKNQREMPWRQPDETGRFDPYHIMVSEFMLQQTQVSRVIPKFIEFISLFPDCKNLATSPLADVLTAWSGLGYNRRAKYLHDASKQLANKPFPRGVDELTDLKGIGNNTAAAILVYSFNQPHLFIETNIRSVILHEFFQGSDKKVSDEAIISMLKTILSAKEQRCSNIDYRTFYWAMMDYGTHLKSLKKGSLYLSAAHKKQPPFSGSRRELRGKVLRAAACGTRLSELQSLEDARLESVVQQLQKEGLIMVDSQRISLPSD